MGPTELRQKPKPFVRGQSRQAGVCHGGAQGKQNWYAAEADPGTAALSPDAGCAPPSCRLE